jgi:hypothetical protein
MFSVERAMLACIVKVVVLEYSGGYIGDEGWGEKERRWRVRGREPAYYRVG